MSHSLCPELGDLRGRVARQGQSQASSQRLDSTGPASLAPVICDGQVVGHGDFWSSGKVAAFSSM